MKTGHVGAQVQTKKGPQTKAKRGHWGRHMQETRSLQMQAKKGHGCTAGARTMGLADADSEGPANADDEELAGTGDRSLQIQTTRAGGCRQRVPAGAGKEGICKCR